MIVDIGGGTTEIAVIALGGLVTNKSIRIAGDDFTADIMDYMNRQHSIKIGETTAEQIKIKVGAALTDLGEDAPEEYLVHGPNKMTSLPMQIPISYQEIAHCLDKSLMKIETAILSALEIRLPNSIPICVTMVSICRVVVHFCAVWLIGWLIKLESRSM